jgi:hypothetical protein
VERDQHGRDGGDACVRLIDLMRKLGTIAHREDDTEDDDDEPDEWPTQEEGRGGERERRHDGRNLESNGLRVHAEDLDAGLSGRVRGGITLDA